MLRLAVALVLCAAACAQKEIDVVEVVPDSNGNLRVTEVQFEVASSDGDLALAQQLGNRYQSLVHQVGVDCADDLKTLCHLDITHGHGKLLLAV